MDPGVARKSASSSDFSRRDLVDAVNYLFILLRDAFPQQFVKAYPTTEVRERARSLWSEGLKDIHPSRIKYAAEKAIKESKFIPSLAQLRSMCVFHYKNYNLKEPLQAYYEACNAPVMDRDYAWSHIIVYLAAKETGWWMLRGEPQSVVFPLFECNYEALSQRIISGENLEGDLTKRLDNKENYSIYQESERKSQQQLVSDMALLNINIDGGREEYLLRKKSWGL